MLYYWENDGTARFCKTHYLGRHKDHGFVIVKALNAFSSGDSKAPEVSGADARLIIDPTKKFHRRIE